MSVSDNVAKLEHHIQTLRSDYQITYPITVLSVTKYATINQIQSLIDAGTTYFGENKVQDTRQKIEVLNNPNLTWDLIGHLQTNKVKLAVSIYSCIQSVDSLRLAQKIDHESQKINKIQSVMIQLNINQNSDQYGFRPDDLPPLINELNTLSHLKITGIMVIGPNTTDHTPLRHAFRYAKTVFQDLQSHFPHLHTLSMGMSQDYDIAIQEGATLIRVGRVLYKI